MFANYYLLIFVLFISLSCGKGQDFVSVGKDDLAEEESAEETSDNAETVDEGVLPPSMVMASYLTGCSIQGKTAVCSIKDNKFTSDFFSEITLFDNSGDLIPEDDLTFSVENGVLVITFPEQYEVSAIKIGDADLPLSERDKNPPTELNLIIAEGAEATNSINIALPISAVDATQMYITNSSDCLDNGVWEAYTNNRDWTLGQVEGPVTVFVKFRDDVGNESACISDTILFDSLAPAQVINFDDGLFTGSTADSASFSWSAATDAGAGISHYELSLGTSLGSDDIKTWQNVGNINSFSFSGLNIVRGTTYYANIRAIDLAGNIGRTVTGDGFNYNFCRSIAVGGSWILVPGNSSYEADDFCVMKYEAKDNGGNPESRSSGQPWVDIDQNKAKGECASLGVGYHVLTNPEWMTLAGNVANFGFNWSGGAVGNGELARGHSDANPSQTCEASEDDNNAFVEGSCNGVALGDDFNQKRTHTLSNGEVIWDLSANVWEWIDYNNATDKPTPNTDVFYEYSLPVVGTSIMPLTDLIPQIAIDNLWNSNQSIGQYYPGVAGLGGALYRGGSYFFGSASGIFNAAMELSSTSFGADIGFRCAIDVP